MQQGRKEKREGQIKEIAARLIERESNKTALITVTRVELDDKLRTGIIYVSVLPETGETAALNFLKRKRADIRDAVKEQLSIGTIPFLDVMIDEGEKARHTIDTLLKSEE